MIKYSIVDVFTRTQFSGNPLAVIHDASRLNSSQMQLVAREFGFSETTFILPSACADKTAQIRIFTPHDEIPFAGHPNIGTAYVIATTDTAAKKLTKNNMLFEELGGEVHIGLLRENEIVVGAQIVAPQGLEIMGTVSPELIASCLGLLSSSIVLKTFEPCVASVGLPFSFVEIDNCHTLASISLDIPSFKKAEQIGPRTVDGFSICAFVILNNEDGELELRSRVFSPLGHPIEDPATGSASGALGKLISKSSGFDKATYKILQGMEMGRPSNITVQATGNNEPPTIQGDCVLVSTGTLVIPPS